MLFGQTLRAVLGDGTVVSTYYGPWFSRQGTEAVFGCNLIASAGLTHLKIQVQTKKVESDNENTTVQPVGSQATIALTADSVAPFQRGDAISAPDGTQGFYELVRYVYELKSNNTEKGWAHFRMLDPTWETD